MFCHSGRSRRICRSFTASGKLAALLLLASASRLGPKTAALGADAVPAAGARLTPGEKRGRQIYLRGTSASGREIKALFGDELTEVPASSLPCVNCHDYNGAGKAEGGVIPSNITPAALTKPYGVVHPSGRKHPPYTDRLLVDAITRGYDPAHNQLSTSMPRYLLEREDAGDLLAYLKRLGSYTDPGLGEDSIRIGAVIPESGPLASAGAAIRAVLAAYCADLNAAGGIFNRRFDLRVETTGGGAVGMAKAVKRLIDEEEVFTLVGTAIEGAETEIAGLLEEEEVPLIGAMTSYPRVAFPLNRYVFYLYSGIREQARVLAEFAASSLGKEGAHRIAILAAGDRFDGDVIAAIRERCEASGWEAPQAVSYDSSNLDAAGVVAGLRDRGIEAVFILGPGADQGKVIREAARASWRPAIFIPGPLAGREILDAPEGFEGQVYLSFPRGPGDKTSAGVAEFRDFARKHGLPPQHLAVQLDAYCALKVFTEGLKRAGRSVSRENLVSSLEGLYEFETGLTPPITFGPNRRVGALGAYVAAVDAGRRAFVPVSEWIKPQ